LKEIEENIKRNKEKDEANKKHLEEKKKKEEYNKKVREDREKKLKENEEKEKKERAEQKRKLKEEQEAKKKAYEERKKKMLEDKKRIEKNLEEFRKKCGLKEEDLWSQKNWKDKQKYWEALGLKEEDLRKQIQLRNYEQKKKEILLQQYQSRNKKKESDSQNDIHSSDTDYNIKKIEDNKKQKKLIENMCIISDIIKNEIKEEIDNTEKYISIEEATETEDKDSSQFVLGLLAKNLEKIGINTVIEKERIKNEE